MAEKNMLAVLPKLSATEVRRLTWFFSPSEKQALPFLDRKVVIAHLNKDRRQYGVWYWYCTNEEVGEGTLSVDDVYKEIIKKIEEVE